MRTHKSIEIHADVYTKTCLTVIVLLLAAIAVTQWGGDEAIFPKSFAQEKPEKPFLDSAEQRVNMIKEIKQTNQKLDELIELFKSGSAKVQVAESAGDKDAGKK